jgi:hypothetical protein
MNRCRFLTHRKAFMAIGPGGGRLRALKKDCLRHGIVHCIAFEPEGRDSRLRTLKWAS